MEISSQSAGAMDGEPAVSQTKLGAGSVACTGLPEGQGEMALRGHNLARGITIHDLSHFFVMLVFLFCKLFEHYSQTNVPIIKTKPFKITKYKKSMADI